MIRLSGLIPKTDIQIEFTGLREGEKLYEELLNNKETNNPTHHEKIMIAKVRLEDFNKVMEGIDDLINLAKEQLEFDIVRKMKKIVPEFLSKNSKFERLDIE